MRDIWQLYKVNLNYIALLCCRIVDVGHLSKTARLFPFPLQDVLRMSPTAQMQISKSHSGSFKNSTPLCFLLRDALNNNQSTGRSSQRNRSGVVSSPPKLQKIVAIGIIHIVAQAVHKALVNDAWVRNQMNSQKRSASSKVI